jgi:Putative transposase
MSPLEFMQRLAALVPRPRLHLIRFHGVLAPNAGLRAAIVPGLPENTSEPADEHAHGAPARLGWARLLKRVFDIDVEHCPQCGGDLKIIAAIEEPAVITRILTHLGLPARAAALPGAAAGAVPGGLILKSRTVLQQHRRSRAARARAKRSNCVAVRCLGTMKGSNGHREGGIFTEHRAIDRLPGRRHSCGQSKGAFKFPMPSFHGTAW